MKDSLLRNRSLRTGPAHDGSLWSGSLWLAWRQQRVLVGIGAVVLAGAAAIAVYSRSGMLDALHSGLFDHCGTGPLSCLRTDTSLPPLMLDIAPLKYLGMLNIALPVLIGVFWGAPLLGRDRELGTHRMVLAQGISRGQWFASRFAFAAATTAALSGLLAGVFAWWRGPAADRSYGLFWYDVTALSGSGPRVVAAALFGLAAGTLLGLLARRVLAAMALTLLVTGAMTLLLEWAHRTRLLVSPHTYVSAGIVPKAPMGEKWSTGHYGLVTASGRHDDVLKCPFPSGAELKECMAQHGYVARFYDANPAGDYWTFQWTDTAVLGGLALLLTAATVLLLRRRV
ncbi:transporter [Streptomyces sp. NBC_01549]|uniref:transporter n=1 Tax=Streptomyces sp. NBC_01549 TaxID=2975874 RepID=UPI0022536881|nr:transporter [Streptomyces sp. NBC_01549]MCX4591319.1 transporter [Streptomyces sp. NBC_01549]